MEEVYNKKDLENQEKMVNSGDTINSSDENYFIPKKDVGISFETIKEKRDSFLVKIVDLSKRRNDMTQEILNIDKFIEVQKNYIAAWNELLTPEMKTDLPEEYVQYIKNFKGQ